MLIFYTNLKQFAEKSILLNNYRQFLNNLVFQYYLSALPKRNYFRILNVGNEFLLDAISTMSKRVRSKSLLKPKKVRRNSSPNNKRSPIPRSCKHSANSNFADYSFDFLSIPTNKVVMNSNPKKMVDVSKGKKKKEKWSSDEELDVVYDLQEEKKNKVYEVITVMSDDETPNKITYERIYADKPEDRIVENPEIVKNTVDFESKNLAIGNVQKVDLDSDNTQHCKVKRESIITKTESNSKSNHNNNDESDDEVVCLAVIDAKTKADMKKASIQEICLSSDSEDDITPTVPPLRLKIPQIPNYTNWSVDHFLSSVGNGSSYGMNNTSSNFAFGFGNRLLYPYVLGKKNTNVSQSLSDWESSSSPKGATSEELSLGITPELISTDGSSLSIVSDLNYQQNIDNFSSIDNENISSPSSSSDEENKIYWKADRQSRRKRELIYEEFTGFGKKVHQGEVTVDSSTSLTFKVMSYNVLAQNLLEEHRYLYKHHDRKALGWAKRWALIYNDIKEENPEILCLQEVENIYLTSHYAKLHDLGYKWIYKKRTSIYEDGVAIFYKSDMFTEDDHAKVEYFQPGVSVLDRDNVGLVVRLRVKKSPTNAIVISTTHLLYNPRRSDVKLAQIQMLLAEIDRLAFDKENERYYPVILTGDFNLKPRNGVYKLITEGQIKYEGMSRRNLNPTDDNNILPKLLIPKRLGITDHCQHIEVLDARGQGKTPPPSTNVYHSECNKNPNYDYCQKDDGFQSGSLQHTFNFRSVYPHVKENGQKEASTHHDNWVTVDYIFYSCQKENNESPLNLLSRLRLPTQNECECMIRFLPNFAFGSDHLPLVGKFLLKLH